jgi:hypothetical protein
MTNINYNPHNSVVDSNVSINVIPRNYGTFAGLKPKTLVNGINYLAMRRKTLRPTMMRQHHAGLTTTNVGGSHG